jgi:hypothetical protein
MASERMLIFRQPCMFAATSSRVLDAAEPVPVFASASASLVNLSLMLLSCIRGGNMMCTSGSRQFGSCRLATVSGASTLTGISCVTRVSRLPPPDPASSKASAPWFLNALYAFEDVVVAMVRAKTGMPPFLVRRMLADVALRADLSARLRAASGTSRLMTLFAAD